MAGKAYRLTGQQIAQPGQVINNAGGATWQIDDWGRLRRFLIIGSEGGTYYVNERALTAQNAHVAIDLIKKDGVGVVDLVKHVSLNGLAPSNDPALFVLALAAKMGDSNTRQAAYANLPLVARTGTHLYHFVSYVEGIAQSNGNSGWSRALRTAVSKWFNDKSASDIEYQITKYQQRDGWSAADLLRLAHIKPVDQDHSNIYSWAVDGWDDDTFLKVKPMDYPRIYGMEAAQRSTTTESIVSLIRTYDLAREHVPTWALNDPLVWDALLYKMPLEAMMRNLGKMSEVGLLVPNSYAEQTVIERLTNKDKIHNARLHPLKIFVAQRTYSEGHGMRGSLTWKPVRRVAEAMEEAFYLSFKNVDPTGKKTMLAIDTSGSMTWSNVGNMPVRPADVASVMAMVNKRVEKENATICAFYTNLTEKDIDESDSFETVYKKMTTSYGGGTDCAQPMVWAYDKKRDFDAFVVYTDSETWAGAMSVDTALSRYRKHINQGARMVVVGMTSTGFTVADPNDALAMDIAGFSTDTPQVLSDFIAGKI